MARSYGRRTLYAGVGIALQLNRSCTERSTAFDANKQFVDGPVNSSTSQISFLWNVISPREKVSVSINQSYENWQSYVILHYVILSPVFWIECKLFLNRYIGNKIYNFIPSFFSSFSFWMNIHTRKIDYFFVSICIYFFMYKSLNKHCNISGLRLSGLIIHILEENFTCTTWPL